VREHPLIDFVCFCRLAAVYYMTKSRSTTNIATTIVGLSDRWWRWLAPPSGVTKSNFRSNCLWDFLSFGGLGKNTIFESIVEGWVGPRAICYLPLEYFQFITPLAPSHENPTPVTVLLSILVFRYILQCAGVLAVPIQGYTATVIRYCIDIISTQRLNSSTLSLKKSRSTYKMSISVYYV